MAQDPRTEDPRKQAPGDQQIGVLGGNFAGIYHITQIFLFGLLHEKVCLSDESHKCGSLESGGFGVDHLSLQHAFSSHETCENGIVLEKLLCKVVK